MKTYTPEQRRVAAEELWPMNPDRPTTVAWRAEWIDEVVAGHKSSSFEILLLVKCELNAAKALLEQVLRDHSEQVRLYGELESQPARVHIMGEIATFLAPEPEVAVVS